ncbi:MAG TPA: enoyl-CoA hydratase-related protein [Rhizomicrobium sp.]|nr:enoyl-CoA hydratase-related protein [Rhizomicrobium sp.]
MNSAVTTSPSRVLLTVNGGIASIVLNGAHNGNAIDVNLARDLKDALHRCEKDKTIRVILLTGGGRIFCAGGDLAAIYQRGDKGPDYVSEILSHLHEAILTIARVPVPVVAGVHGAAAGAGLALACSCDLAIAAASARFILAYGRVGLTPDGSSSWFLPQLIGVRRSLELALLGRELSARDALDWGLVNEVVADTDLATRLGEIGKALSIGAVAAFGQAKRLLRNSSERDLETQMKDELETLRGALRGTEAAIGMEAFLQKRPAKFV